MASNTNFLVANAHAAVTAADTDLSRVPDALFVGVAGTIVITDLEGTVVTATLPAGGYWYGRVVRVAAASTATGIIALYEHGIV